MKNKIAVLGKGKTGSKLIELLTEEKIPFEVFDSQNKFTKERAVEFSWAISFLTAEVFAQYIDIFTSNKINLISGTTGFSYTEALKNEIKKNELVWIVANNFSLGMILMTKMINIISRADIVLNHPQFHIHEVHHTKKLDAPSGTAKSFQEWLNKPVQISSERIGDVIGFHELSLKTNSEEIKISHNALDRKIFAEGAVWSLKYANNKKLTAGLHQFSDLVSKELFYEPRH
jgi:4-hydroxy-tetrahydrodipicolinate reductase